MCADLIFELLRLSTVKKCPHMLRSDHRGLRNSKVKLMWVGGGGGGWVVVCSPSLLQVVELLAVLSFDLASTTLSISEIS